MTNKEVARVLYRIAALMEFSDENPFKVRSYRMAAETAESLTKPLSELAEEGGAARLKVFRVSVTRSVRGSSRF